MNGRIISFLAAIVVMLMTVPVTADAGYKPPNLTFKNSQGVVVGTFSHDFHLQIYNKCRDCHTRLFPFGNGKRMTMADMYAGKSAELAMMVKPPLTPTVTATDAMPTTNRPT